MLHLLGFDHEKSTYCYTGRDFCLTNVHGKVVKVILASWSSAAELPHRVRVQFDAEAGLIRERRQSIGVRAERRADQVIDEVQATPPAEGVDRVLLPGEREMTNRRRATTDGIPLPADVVASLELAATTANVPSPWT